MKYLLMIPGPVEISEDILEAFQGQPVAHYGPEWAELYLETAENFSGIIGSDGRTFLIPGSGSLGLDTAAATFCRSRKCLVLQNGMFGERLYSIVSTHTSDVKTLQFPLNAPIDPSTVKKTLESEKYDILLMTQVETSTGVLNPVEDIGKITGELDIMFILDAISSAGIEELKMDQWGIDIVITASQKGLECPPGLGIVTVKTPLLDDLKKNPASTWYTDLRVWCEYYEKWHDWHPFPVTLPTNIILALSRSLKIIKSEGIISRQNMYRKTSSKLRKSISALGLQPYAPEYGHAHGLTAVSTTGIFKPSDLVVFLKKEMGVQIAGSFGDIQELVFRIGHMSRKQCRNINLMSVLTGIALFMESKGIKAPLDEAAGHLLG